MAEITREVEDVVRMAEALANIIKNLEKTQENREKNRLEGERLAEEEARLTKEFIKTTRDLEHLNNQMKEEEGLTKAEDEAATEALPKWGLEETPEEATIETVVNETKDVEAAPLPEHTADTKTKEEQEVDAQKQKSIAEMVENVPNEEDKNNETQVVGNDEKTDEIKTQRVSQAEKPEVAEQVDLANENEKQLEPTQKGNEISTEELGEDILKFLSDAQKEELGKITKGIGKVEITLKVVEDNLEEVKERTPGILGRIGEKLKKADQKIQELKERGGNFVQSIPRNIKTNVDKFLFNRFESVEEKARELKEKFAVQELQIQEPPAQETQTELTNAEERASEENEKEPPAQAANQTELANAEEKVSEENEKEPQAQAANQTELANADKPIEKPVYRESVSYASEHGESDQYRTDAKLNTECRDAIDTAIRESQYGTHSYKMKDAAKQVIDTYGSERVGLIMAKIVTDAQSDVRYSRQNKDWAKDFEVPQSMTDIHSGTHPVLLDGFLSEARKNEHEIGLITEVIPDEAFSDRNQPTQRTVPSVVDEVEALTLAEHSEHMEEAYLNTTDVNPNTANLLTKEEQQMEADKNKAEAMNDALAEVEDDVDYEEDEWEQEA